MTGAVCTPSWEFCRGLCYLLEKEPESSSTKYQILHLFLQCEILGLGAGGEWWLRLPELGESSDVSLMFTPMCVASQAITTRYKKICCFLPYHSCAVMDRTEPLVGIAESHGYLHDILQEMRLELFYSLTLRFQSTFFPLQGGSPTHSSSYSTSPFLPGVTGLEQKQVLPIWILKPRILFLLNRK